MLNSKNNKLATIAAACAIMLSMPVWITAAYALSANYLNDTHINYDRDMNGTAPYALNKKPLIDFNTFECRHGPLVPRYKNATGQYDPYNPYNTIKPNCILSQYNYYHPEHPLPFFYNGTNDQLQSYLNTLPR